MMESEDWYFSTVKYPYSLPKIVKEKFIPVNMFASVSKLDAITISYTFSLKS